MERETILHLSALELAKAIRKQEITSEQAVEAVLEKTDKTESDLHAYVSVFREDAPEIARKRDAFVREMPEGTELPPLWGVPVAIKDNLLLQGKKTTCGSKMLENYISPYTATCVEILEKAGAIVIGKTNMDEFGMGVSTENSFFGPTIHPLDPTRVPGGSSGGSAAAVGSGSAFAALGTDTGGSVRQPAAYCGLFGLRPTYGTVSRHGLVAFSSSMDVAGPITRSSLDLAAIYNIVTGADDKDMTSVCAPSVDFLAMKQYSPKGKRIGIPKQLFSEEKMDQEILKAMKIAIEELESSGARIDLINMPILDYAVAVYYILSSAEASSNLSRYDGIRYGYRASDVKDLADLYTKTRSEGFGLEVKRRILLGNYVLSSEHFEDCYRKAEKARDQVRSAFDEAFSEHDLLLSPTSPMVAPKLGESLKDPLAAYVSDLCTVPASLAGIPAVSIPVQSSTGLPCGIQLMARKFGEQELLGASYFHEKHCTSLERRGDA